MASTYLSRTPASSGNLKTWTFSTWFKKGSGGYLLGVADMTDGDPGTAIEVGNAVLFSIYNGGYVSRLDPLNLARDVSGWYHYVVSVDTTQATASDRVKIYLNGERITSFSTETYPPQNYDTMVNSSSYEHRIGDRGGNSFDGSMSHVHLIDGTAYDATAFGEFDANGVWTPKTSPSVTYGTNGFFLKFENSGSMGLDSSGNGNNFTVNGTLTQTLDTPSNVYATFNPLIPQGLAYANGNLSATHNAASWKSAYGTFAMSGTGKYYFESKVSTLGSFQGVGIVDAEQISSSASKFGAVSRGYGYKNDGNKTNNDVDVSYGATYTTGDIIMCAVDLNAGAIWWGKNGTWQNSATQSEIEAGTTTNAGYTGISNSYVYLPAVQIYGSGTNQLNTGNGYFGTTAVSSAGSNGNGSIFEYDVPSGYYALNTKNLATYG